MPENAGTLELWPEVLMATYPVPPLEVVSGRGARLTDAEGREHIDMLAGIAVNSLGYGHPGVVAAVERQIRSFAHVSNLLGSAPAVDLARRLVARLARGDAATAEATRVFFANSGAEANEAAFKIVRLTGRRRVLAAEHGFHGRTMGALALTGQPGKRAPFEPLPGGVSFYPYGDLGALRRMVAEAPGDVAAIFLEPVQGETGVIPAPEGFLTGVREVCDEHGILMVVDEVQTGVGRTGLFFAHEIEDVRPDIVTMAKGLGAGLPIGACLATGRAAGLLDVGEHGTTFGGNPVACAAAGAVLDAVDEDLLRRVRENGEWLRGRLSELSGVDHVRGRGLMLGVVLHHPVARETVAAGLRHGVILNAPAPDVIRLVPPLIITPEDLESAVERIAAALAEAGEDREGDES